MRIVLSCTGLVVLLAAIACGGDAPEGHNPSTATATATAAASLAGPPPARATFDFVTATMGVGSHCWSAPGSAGICRDVSGPVTGAQSLIVRSGGRVTLTTGFPGSSVTEVSATALVTQGQPTATSSGEVVWNMPPVGGQKLPAAFDASGGYFQADLAPGRYAVLVFLRVPQGDVTYGALIEVK